MNAEEIIMQYTNGEKTAEQVNEELKEINCSVRLNPGNDIITEEELAETIVGDKPEQANGYGMMDHGVGRLEKVKVVNGCTVNVDMGAELAFVFIKDRKYKLEGTKLVDIK